jgi:HK97 family phage major capsid protein
VTNPAPRRRKTSSPSARLSTRPWSTPKRLAGQSSAAERKPTMKDKYFEWEQNGRPGTFSVIAYPDYSILTNSRVENWGNRQRNIEGREWYPTPELRADIINETGNSGAAYTIPTKVYNDIVWHLNAVSGIVQAGPTILQTPDDATLTVPTFATDATAALTAEGTEATDVQPVFASKTLNAYRYDLHFHVGNETLRSSAVPMESILANACSRSLATAIATAMATGTGSSQPQGLSAHATCTLTTGVTTASASALTMNEMVNLKLSVPAQYRKQAKVVLATTAYNYLPLLVNGEGSYLWQPSVQASEPDRILGMSIYEDSFYDATGTTAHVIGTCGDFSAVWQRFAGPIVIEASDAPTWTSFETTWRAAVWFDQEIADLTALRSLVCI